MFRPILAVSLAVFVGACSGESSTPTPVASSGAGSSSGSSSGASSSGASSGESSSGEVGCDAICSTGANLIFDESNEGGRLDGAHVETCARGQCSTGTIVKEKGPIPYRVSMTRDGDAGAPRVEVSVGPAPTGNALRFRVNWSFGYGRTDGVADGDVYTLVARTSAGGPELFKRTFTATYSLDSVCGSTCKVYEVGP